MFYVYALYKLQVLKHIHQQTGLGSGDRAWTVVGSDGGLFGPILKLRNECYTCPECADITSKGGGELIFKPI